MTQKEITRLRVINQTIDKVLTIREAAIVFGVAFIIYTVYHP